MDSKWTPDTNFLVVINHHSPSNSIEWAERLIFPYIVYSSFPSETGGTATHKAKGEGTILKFVSDFYDKLPQNIVLVSDSERQFSQKGTSLQILNDANFPLSYKCSKTPGFWNWGVQKLGPVSQLSCKMMISGWWTQCMAANFGPMAKHGEFSSGKSAYSQFVVSRERIRALPKEFYSNMYTWIVENTIDEEPLVIDPITTFKDYPSTWTSPHSNHHVALYLRHCWELIFTGSKLGEGSIVLSDGRRMSAVYGSKDIYLDVSSKVRDSFWQNGNIVVPSNVVFNDIFGDVAYGVPKSLRITINDQTIIISEYRTITL